MPSLETFNHGLFLLVNAGPELTGWPLELATGAATGGPTALAAALCWIWLRGNESARAAVLQALVAMTLALVANQLIRRGWPHPRPFAVGLGHVYLPHRPDASFPSNHASGMWSVALVLLLHGQRALACWTALLLAAITSWARVFLGVHFPLDIAGSIAIAVVAAGITLPLHEPLRRELVPRIAASVRSARGWVARHVGARFRH